MVDTDDDPDPDILNLNKFEVRDDCGSEGGLARSDFTNIDTKDNEEEEFEFEFELEEDEINEKDVEGVLDSNSALVCGMVEENESDRETGSTLVLNIWLIESSEF